MLLTGADMFKPALLRNLSKELVDVVGIPGQDPVPENKSSMKIDTVGMLGLSKHFPVS